MDGLNYPPDYTPRNRYLDGGNMVLDGLWSQEQATHGRHPHGRSVAARAGAAGLRRVGIRIGLCLGLGWRQRAVVGAAGTYFLALGIDPRAGTDPESSDIVWTQGITVTDLWVPLSLEMPIHTSTVTVFTRGQPLRILAHNVSRWDEACLRVVRPVDGPTATPTARQWPSRTPGPDEPTPTVTASATSDPATQAALDVGLALDMQATQDAASEPGGTDDRRGRGQDWAEDAATPTPDAGMRHLTTTRPARRAFDRRVVRAAVPRAWSARRWAGPRSELAQAFPRWQRRPRQP